MTNFLAENFPGLLPLNRPDGSKTMNARQWQFLVQSLGMHWAKALLFFPKKPMQTGSSDFSGMQLTNINTGSEFVVSAESKSALLGVPVFCDLVLEDPHTGNRLNIVNPIITITQSRNITKTVVQGRNGTVKEYVSDGDYQIDIDGALFTTDGSYPQADMDMLVSLCKATSALSVYAHLLKMFDITSAVVEKYEFRQTLMQDMQLFKINMLSDEPYEIKEFT